MQTDAAYIEKQPFVDKIISYYSESLRDVPDYKIILEGLKIYLGLTGCNSASLFSIDQESFEFFFRTSTTQGSENDLRQSFERLIEEGAVAEALNTYQIIEYTLEPGDGSFTKFLIIPLVTHTGIVGINLLTLSKSIINNKHLIKLCQLHSGNFALTVSNMFLSYELNRIRKNTEQKIAFKTNNIVKTSRELKKILDSIQDK